ncbi:unnamed protein product, partial [Closterium sp. NIES-64]
EVLFTLIKELSDAHPEIKNPEQSAALLGGIKVELPSERERELMQQIAEMRCKVATLVDNVITYRKRNAQLEEAGGGISVAEGGERSISSFLTSALSPSLLPFPVFPPTPLGEADGDISAEEGGERIISSFLTSALSPSLPFPVFLRSLPQRVGASVREAGGGISAEEGGERKAGRGAETREVT